MKKTGFILFFTFFFFIILGFYFFNQKKFYQLKIKDKNYKLLIAKNEKEWERGLMFYRSKNDLGEASGMIFLFPDKKIRSFWNMNTYLDLKIYWLSDEKIIGEDILPNILKTKTPLTITSKQPVNKVVEIVIK